MNTLKKLFLTMVFSAGLHADWIFPPIDIPETNTTNLFLNVGIDASGKAIAVWDFPDSAQVFSSNWNGSAWSAIEILALDSAASRLAVSANGTALTVYIDTSTITNSVEGRFWNGTSWVASEPIGVGTTGVERPNVVMNSNGIGFATWKDSLVNLRTRRWNGTSWDSEVTVTGSGASSDNQNIAMNNSEDVVVIWGDTFGADVKASTWNGSSWNSAETLSTDFPVAIFDNNRMLGIDDAGNAVAVWGLLDGGLNVTEIQGSVYNKGTDTWTRTSDIPVTGFTDGMLAVSPNGETIGILVIGGELKSITLNGLTWSDPLTFATSVDAAGAINLVVDASGNAIATWVDAGSSPTQILASTWDGSEWSAPETLSDVESPMRLYDNLDSAINTSGDAVVIWGVEDSILLNSKAFTPDDFIGTTFGSGFFQPISPSDFAGRIGKNKFLTQTEHINFLTWAPSPDTSVVGYRVYQGESIVAEVPSEGPFEATIHNRIKNFPYTYRLVAINASGQESDPLILNVN